MVRGGAAKITVCLRRSEDNFVESALSYLYLGSETGNSVARFTSVFTLSAIAPILKGPSKNNSLLLCTGKKISSPQFGMVPVVTILKICSR